MVFQHSFFALCLAQLSTAISFQGRSSVNHTSAPYSNSTSQAESSIFTSTTASQLLSLEPSSARHGTPASEIAFTSALVAPESTDAASAAVDLSPKNITEARNASCTVNVPSASIEWWYPATYTHAVATITSSWGNFSEGASYTFVPVTTSFDTANAVRTQNVCTSGWTTYPEWNYTAWDCLPYTVKPTAATTSFVSRSAAPPFPTPAAMPMGSVWRWDLDLAYLPSMTATISIAPNTTVEEVMPTPFVHFTAYEVEYRNSTETVQLSSVYVQPYWHKNIEAGPTADGAIPDGFVDQLPESACEAGVLQAVVTVIIFVEYYYHNRPYIGVGDVHWEIPAVGWEDEAVGVEGQPLTNTQPLFITDWDLPGQTTEDAEPKTTQGRDTNSITRPEAADGLIKATQALSSQTVGTVGSAPVVIGPSSVVVVGTQTLRPGGPAVTVGGTAVALAPSATAIIVGGSSLPLPQQNVRPGQHHTIGNFGTNPVVIGPSSVVTIGTQTLQPGGPAITLGPGTVVSLPPSGTALIVGGTTSVLPQVSSFAPHVAAPPILTVGSITLIPNAATQFFIEPGQTLIPGGTAIIDGVKVSLESSAAFVVIGSSTHMLPTPGAASLQSVNAQAELVLDGTTFTARPSSSMPNTKPGNRPGAPGGPQAQEVGNQDEPGPVFVIAGQTLSPGGVPITVSDSTLSLAPFGAFLVIDGSTTTLAASTAAAVAAHVTPPPLTIGNGVFRPLPGSGTYQIGTAILTPGGSVVVAGTTISLAAGATALVVNGVTTVLAADAQAVITNPPLLTIGSRTYTAAPGTGTAFIIEGQTLTPGGTIIIDGTTIVLSPQATELVYGSSGRSTSTTLFPATTTRGAITFQSASASEGQSGFMPAAPTSSRQGAASTMHLPFSVFFGALICTGWLLY